MLGLDLYFDDDLNFDHFDIVLLIVSSLLIRFDFIDNLEWCCLWLFSEHFTRVLCVHILCIWPLFAFTCKDAVLVLSRIV